jgi:hypothetical protein
MSFINQGETDRESQAVGPDYEEEDVSKIMPCGHDSFYWDSVYMCTTCDKQKDEKLAALLSAAKAALPHMRGANNPSSGLTAARRARTALEAAVAEAEKP